MSGTSNSTGFFLGFTTNVKETFAKVTGEYKKGVDDVLKQHDRLKSSLEDINARAKELGEALAESGVIRDKGRITSKAANMAFAEEFMRSKSGRRGVKSIFAEGARAGVGSSEIAKGVGNFIAKSLGKADSKEIDKFSDKLVASYGKKIEKWYAKSLSAPVKMKGAMQPPPPPPSDSGTSSGDSGSSGGRRRRYRRGEATPAETLSALVFGKIVPGIISGAGGLAEYATRQEDFNELSMRLGRNGAGSLFTNYKNATDKFEAKFTTRGMTEQAAAASRAGLSADQTARLQTETLQAADSLKAFGVSANDNAEILTPLIQKYRLTSKELTENIKVYGLVGRAAGLSARELGNLTQRIGSVPAMRGMGAADSSRFARRTAATAGALNAAGSNLDVGDFISRLSDPIGGLKLRTILGSVSGMSGEDIDQLVQSGQTDTIVQLLSNYATRTSKRFGNSSVGRIQQQATFRNMFGEYGDSVMGLGQRGDLGKYLNQVSAAADTGPFAKEVTAALSKNQQWENQVSNTTAKTPGVQTLLDTEALKTITTLANATGAVFDFGWAVKKAGVALSGLGSSIGVVMAGGAIAAAGFAAGTGVGQWLTGSNIFSGDYDTSSYYRSRNGSSLELFRGSKAVPRPNIQLTNPQSPSTEEITKPRPREDGGGASGLSTKPVSMSPRTSALGIAMAGATI